MKITSASREWSGKVLGKAFVLLVGIGMLGATAVAPVRAITDGETQIEGDALMARFGYPVLTNITATPTAVNLDNTSYSYIRNDYLAFVMGESGSGNFSRTYGTDTITYEVPGRISFGNIEGSLQSGGADNNGPLTGIPDGGTTGELWPLASDRTFEGFFNMTGFVALNIDPATPNAIGTNVTLGQNAPRSGFSRFFNNQLVTTFRTPNNVFEIQQTVRLRRATARMEWVIRNLDAQRAHTVGLQFVNSHIPVRFFIDPNRGATTQPTQYTGGTVPNTIDLVESRVNPLYHPRYTFRGYGATPPDRVLVTAVNSYFRAGYVIPDITAFPSFLSSRVFVGVACYWEPAAIPAGGTRTIVTYFGNGAPTEDLAADYVTGVEAIESLAFNTRVGDPLAPDAAPNTLTDPQKTGATLQTGAAFLSPQSLTVFGSVYNQTVANPDQEVVLNNVSMSLTLPVGLRLGLDDRNNPETATKTVGSVRGDTNAVQRWNVVPTGESYGSLTYQVAVTAPPLGSRTISRVINVPATPLRQLQNTDWNLISFPFAFNPAQTNNGDPNTILNRITAPADNPGGVVPIFRYDPFLASNGSYPYVRATKLEPGVAYFYRPSLNRTVLATGAVPVAEQAPESGVPGTPFQVSLERGFNMIGNPYVYDIPLAYLRIVPLENNPSLRSFGFSEAIIAGLIRGAVFFYAGQQGTNNSRYEFLQSVFDPLRPWIGYWLYANSRVNLIYAAPTSFNSAVQGTTSVAPPANRSRSASASRALVANPTLDEWKLQLAARTEDGREDNTALIGVSRAAKDDDDIRDFPKPAPFRDYVYVGIERAGTATRWAQDLKTPGGKKSWDVEAVSDREGKVTLSWPNMATLPKRLRLKLTDLSNNRSINMRSSSSFTFAAAKESAHRFRITAEPALSRPLAITNLRSVKSRAGGYSFNFNLTSDASVTGRIRTLGGKIVRSVDGGRASVAGQNTVHWDGRGSDGQNLPVGPYLLEIAARDEEGEVVVEKAPLLLLR